MKATAPEVLNPWISAHKSRLHLPKHSFIPTDPSKAAEGSLQRSPKHKMETLSGSKFRSPFSKGGNSSEFFKERENSSEFFKEWVCCEENKEASGAASSAKV